MASRELKVEIIGDSKSLQKALGSATDSSSKFGSTLAKMGKMAAVGLGALGVGAVVAGKQMVNLASDAAEVESKLQVIFGKELPGLKKNLDAFAEATGASKFALREMGADMGALLEPLVGSKKGAADMSVAVVKLATDLSSFNNVPVEEALLAIRSGLVGEAEPLRRFGVLLNAAAVETEGLRMGLVKQGETMTEADKVAARYSLVMKQTTLAQGDATRTADSAANQFKALKNNLTDAATEMGQKLLPAVLSVVQSFNKNWPQIEKIVDAVMDGLIQGATMAANAVRTHFNTIKTIATTTFQGALDAGRALSNFFSSEMGQKLALGAAGFLAVSKAIGGIQAAATLANKGLFMLKANPLWAALIPLGFALGTVAQKFIESKIEAANAAAAWDAALDAANRLKSSLAGLAGAQLDVRQATLDVKTTTADHATALGAASDALARYGPGSAQYAAALKAEEQAAINADSAALRLADSKDRVNKMTTETKAISASASQAIVTMAGSMDKASGSSIKSAQLQGLQTKEADAYIKKLSQLIPTQEAIAQKYRSSEPALAAQASKTAELARRLSELAKETGKVPSKKDIIATAKLVGGPAFAKSVQGIITGSDKAQKGAKKELDKLPGHVESAIAAGETAAGGASGIATTITSGIESGFNFGGVIATVRAGVQAAIEAGRNAGSTTESIAKPIGKDITEGAGKGVKEGEEKLKEVTAATVRKAVGAAQLAVATKELGVKAVNGIISGIVGESPSLKKQFADAAREMSRATLSNAEIQALNKRFGKDIMDKVRAGMKDATPTAVQEAAAAAREIVASMKAAVVTAQEGLKSAFGNLISAALAAFDAKAAEWKPPTLQLLEAIEIQEQKQALIDAINRAGTELGEAVAAMQEAVAGGDPEKIKAAQAQVLTAQKALQDAQVAQAKAAMREVAAAEQQAHDEQAAKDRERLETRLKAIQAKYLREKDISVKEQRQMNKEIAAAMGEAGLDAQTAGQAISNSLAAGIRSAIIEVRKAVQELANVLRKNLKMKSPTEEGPLSDIDTWWTGLGASLAKQLGTDEVTMAATGLGTALRNALIPAGDAAVLTWQNMGVAKDALITNLGLFVDQSYVTATSMQQNLIQPTEDWIARLMAAVQETAAVGTALKELDGTSATIYLYRKVITSYEEDTGQSRSNENPTAGGDIPGFAAGGIVRKRTLAWIGEKGAEAVVPLSRSGSVRKFAKALGTAMAAASDSGGGGGRSGGSQPYGHQDSQGHSGEVIEFTLRPANYPPALSRRGGETNITMNFNAPIGGEQDFARKYAPAIADEFRRSQRRGDASVIQLN